MILSKALGAIPLFSGLTEEQLEYVAKYLKRRSYAERDVIVRRGTPGDALFILTSGKAKCAYLDSEDETIIAIYRPGDFFGEFSVLDGEERSADVVALEPTEVLALPAEDFHACLHAVPAIAVELLKQLAGRLRRATSWIRSLSSQDVYGRIASQLLHLSKTHGVDVENGAGRRIELRLTQNDMASLVGASRESVNKAMGYFKQKGFITVDTTYHITVYNHDALVKRAA
ncbi:Crp/Fnr family transcriptional regulator [Armatimonas sp.]|uniref:Crp/Fnr family transcriptional regulator n=1 Tax=Armatimonas sp. TaxID=1872638 RepID=UPI00286B7412|nr:Crp/Fnr family transcriptional regulator [Armatimonas sp.]